MKPAHKCKVEKWSPIFSKETNGKKAFFGHCHVCREKVFVKGIDPIDRVAEEHGWFRRFLLKLGILRWLAQYQDKKGD